MSDAGPSPDLFFDTMGAYQRTAALKAALELDVFTIIGDGARTVADIAARCSAPARGVGILCDYLAIVGFLSKVGGQYSLTADSAVFLSKHSPAYLGGTAAFLASPDLMRNFDRLAETIRRGTVTEDGNTVVEYENPLWVQFARAMVPMMMPAAQAMAGVLDVASAGPIRVLDIAAGHGMFGVTIAQRNPRAEVVAVDWPGVLAVATENAQKMGVGARHQLLPGDAFKVDYGTGFDLALLTNFLHHFDRETCTRLLRKIAGSLAPGGRVAILEFVPNADRISPPTPAGFALTMLAGTPAGTAYTLGELEAMAADAGLSGCRAFPMPTPETLVVASKS